MWSSIFNNITLDCESHYEQISELIYWRADCEISGDRIKASKIQRVIDGMRLRKGGMRQ